jgi:hypothetical protein
MHVICRLSSVRGYGLHMEYRAQSVRVAAVLMRGPSCLPVPDYCLLRDFSFLFCYTASLGTCPFHRQLFG